MSPDHDDTLRYYSIRHRREAGRTTIVIPGYRDPILELVQWALVLVLLATVPISYLIGRENMRWIGLFAMSGILLQGVVRGLHLSSGEGVREVVVDANHRTVEFPGTSKWPAYEFGFDELVSFGIDSVRPSGAEAFPVLASTYVVAELSRPRASDPTLCQCAILDLGGLGPEQTRVLIEWIIETIGPEIPIREFDRSRLAQLDQLDVSERG